MNHSCHKCGRNIEDGKPFCPECGAPQIRVMIPEVSAEPVLAGSAAVLARQSDAAPVLPSDSASPLPGPWSRDLKACSLAAAVALALTFVGLNPFVASVVAGCLAVALFRRGGMGAALRPANGAKLGALSGLLLFGMSTVFEVIAVTVLHKGAELRNELLEKIQQVSDRYPGPQVQPFLDFVKTPEGFAFMMAGSVMFGLVAFVALGGLGGAIGAAIMGKRSRP